MLENPSDSRLLYARVDGLDVEGQLVLMELELIEPGLFLDRAGCSHAVCAGHCYSGHTQLIEG